MINEIILYILGLLLVIGVGVLEVVILKRRKGGKLMSRVISLISDIGDNQLARVKFPHLKYECIVEELNEDKVTNLTLKYYNDFVIHLLSSENRKSEPLLCSLIDILWDWISKDQSRLVTYRDGLIYILDYFTDLQ